MIGNAFIGNIVPQDIVSSNRMEQEGAHYIIISIPNDGISQFECPLELVFNNLICEWAKRMFYLLLARR